MVQQKTRPPASSTTMPIEYREDIFGWAQEQVALLEAGRFDEIDAGNIAEELRDVGNEQRFKLESAIAVLTQHLLKWDHQSERRSRSWELSIAEQRRRITTILRRSPSLKAQLGESVELGYADGRGRALDETGLPKSAIPETCPYTFDELMTREIEYGP